LEFEWDENKNRENQRKHEICFEEAKLIFEGIYFTRIDPRDYGSEIREISIGSIGGGVILVIVHAQRDGKTRIISARKATKKERRRFYAAFRGFKGTS
jgi:hypothetical protein